jgi:hypothetical protein
MKKVIAALAIIAVAVNLSFAAKVATVQSVGSKTAIGFSNQMVGLMVSSFAVRSWLTNKIGVEGLLGFYSSDTDKQFGIGGKFLYLIKEDSATKFYGAGVVAVRSIDNGFTSENYVTIGAGLGWEVFITEVKNLSLCAEIGLGYDSEAKAFGTLGFGLDTLGIRYYF